MPKLIGHFKTLMNVGFTFGIIAWDKWEIFQLGWSHGCGCFEVERSDIVGMTS